MEGQTNDEIQAPWFKFIMQLKKGPEVERLGAHDEEFWSVIDCLCHYILTRVVSTPVILNKCPNYLSTVARSSLRFEVLQALHRFIDELTTKTVSVIQGPKLHWFMHHSSVFDEQQKCYASPTILSLERLLDGILYNHAPIQSEKKDIVVDPAAEAKDAVQLESPWSDWAELQERVARQLAEHPIETKKDDHDLGQVIHHPNCDVIMVQECSKGTWLQRLYSDTSYTEIARFDMCQFPSIIELVRYYQPSFGQDDLGLIPWFDSPTMTSARLTRQNAAHLPILNKTAARILNWQYQDKPFVSGVNEVQLTRMGKLFHDALENPSESSKWCIRPLLDVMSKTNMEPEKEDELGYPILVELVKGAHHERPLPNRILEQQKDHCWRNMFFGFMFAFFLSILTNPVLSQFLRSRPLCKSALDPSLSDSAVRPEPLGLDNVSAHWRTPVHFLNMDRLLNMTESLILNQSETGKILELTQSDLNHMANVVKQLTLGLTELKETIQKRLPVSKEPAPIPESINPSNLPGSWLDEDLLAYLKVIDNLAPFKKEQSSASLSGPESN